MKNRFDFFTGRALKVLELAQEEAIRLQHNYIGTEHLLLGMIREGEGIAGRSLGSLGVDLNTARRTVESIIGCGKRAVHSEVRLTQRAKKVIELAMNEARLHKHHYIGTEHLLLGLIREGQGVAAGALESMNVNLEELRDVVEQVLDKNVQIGGRESPNKRFYAVVGTTAIAGIALIALGQKLYRQFSK